VVKRLLLVWGFKSTTDQISHALPATHHRYNLEVWALVQSCGDGDRLLVTPKRIASVTEDLILCVCVHRQFGVYLSFSFVLICDNLYPRKRYEKVRQWNATIVLLNPEKNLAQIRLVVFEKNAKNAPLILKNDVTEPKARIL